MILPFPGDMASPATLSNCPHIGQPLIRQKEQLPCLCQPRRSPCSPAAAQVLPTSSAISCLVPWPPSQGDALRPHTHCHGIGLWKPSPGGQKTELYFALLSRQLCVEWGWSPKRSSAPVHTNNHLSGWVFGQTKLFHASMRAKGSGLLA